MIDWGTGRYERTAAELEPVARHVVALARVEGGERVLDLACGTGNAALLAARDGAIATGLDAAPRLIEVAHGRAAAAGAPATFVVGDLQELPFEDGAYDAVLSVFGVIFAADASRAFDELVRVLRPGGRVVVTAWVPAGALDAMVGVFNRALAAASGDPSRPRFAWHDADAVGELAARHDAAVEIEDAEAVFVGDSPEAYFAAIEAEHPLSLAGRPVLERAGTYAAARAEALDVLRAGNEDPDRFRVTSTYRVITIRRPPPARAPARP